MIAFRMRIFGREFGIHQSNISVQRILYLALPLTRIQNLARNNLPPLHAIDDDPQRNLAPHLDRIPTGDRGDRT
ncbi:MAG: hypothetical protein ACFB9N_15365 [Geitlerinemataceae cyanobacterium]|mgnify:CR=1 FL=1